MKKKSKKNKEYMCFINHYHTSDDPDNIKCTTFTICDKNKMKEKHIFDVQEQFVVNFDENMESELEKNAKYMKEKYGEELIIYIREGTLNLEECKCDCGCNLIFPKFYTTDEFYSNDKEETNYSLN